MASSHSSSPVPQGSSSDVFFKKEVDPTKHIRPVQSLPDVCPKEPTGDSNSLCVAPSLVTDQHRWTIYHSKVNLPAALNDPRLAKRESDFFTKTWGLDFVDTEVIPSFYLPQISKEHFTVYQQEISQREKIHERCKNICPPKDNFDRTLLHTHDKSRTDLDQVPKIFMKPDFALDDSLTFNSVLPWSHFNTAGGKGNRDAASSKLLQEKLSHYLDIVEVNIAHQISLRSEAFFHAMTSQHELQDYLKKTSQAVKMLRDKIAQIDKVMCEGPLHILRLALTRNNCVKVYNKLKLMATVHQTQPTVQVLLSTSEFVGALDLIATTQEVLQQELQGIHSFRHLGSQLCELEKLIDKMMIAEFSSYSHSDLNRPLEDDRQILEECVIDKVSQIEDIDTDAVMKLADQMRMLNFPQWFDLLKDIFSKFTVFLQRVKATLNIIHSVVLSVLDKNQRTRELEEISQQKNAAKDNSLDTEVAYLIHEGMFISDAFSESELTPIAIDTTSQRNASPNSEPCSSDSVSEPECTTDSSSSKEQTSSSATPGGVDIITGSLKAVISSHMLAAHTQGLAPLAHLGGQAHPGVNEDMKLTDLELGKLANTIQELVYSASDICHDRAVKFLMSRAKDGFLEKLNSTEFITLSRLMETFILDTEQICGRKSMSLLGALQSQANKFVNRFHEERKTKLSLLLDNERWKQADVPAEFQDLVDSISDGKIALPEKKSGATEERKPAEVLIVEGQQYAVVGTVLLLIRIILEYCQCVDNIPSITTDMLTRLSDLLKLIVHYIPVIRAHFEARLQPKQYSMLRHFDHITKDYHDHIAEISAKLVAIMDSLFDKLLSKYEVKAPVPSACFRNICKQMAKMHEAIFDLLPEEQTQMLFLRINASYKLHLKKQLSHLNVINDGGPQNGLVTADVAFYTGNLQALKGLKDLDLNMAEIWEQKR
ncbi:Vacuolar protein sorting-associated protein 54 [Pteropus alecto]|uniref:Vacuolar protein sorting-associated protein 54 n=1 Tax=Pteropus alecto TaxID=9402 RepID=L5KTC1_PTEAL|nr:Vacuolar protein sorting-associated protein 54 [Pteropus alecto]